MSEEDYKECDDNKECTELALERMRYFTGRFMTARDFRDEQAYHLTHRLLHNQILHGWGVVCGLHVNEHPSKDCRDDHVKVSSGMAVDCCGREVVVGKNLVPPPIPWNERPADTSQSSYENKADEDDQRYYPLLCLTYEEKLIEQVPVLYSEGNCDEQRREYSRILEGYKFTWRWVRRRDLPKYHWKVRGRGCDDEQERADYDDSSAEQSGQALKEDSAEDISEDRAKHQSRLRPCPEDDCDSDSEHYKSCLEPDCPPHHCIPLAWIRSRPHSPIDNDDIVIMGRPTLRPPAQSLTHICEINWPHGGVVSRGRLERLKRLEVRFDRRLKKPEKDAGRRGPYGINASTFVVQYGARQEDLDFVPYTKSPHVEQDCYAVYSISPEGSAEGERAFSYLENQVVFVTLKCDFILDCHDVPVDGDHLGGLLPSGNGIRGGIFESWFRVLPDHEYENYKREHGRY